MAKATFDIPSRIPSDITSSLKDIRGEAQRGLHAYVGAADLALAAVKGYVSDARTRLTKAQKSVKSFDFQPKSLRHQAGTVVTSTVDELSKDAKARRDTVEKRVAQLQAEAQKFVSANVETAGDTYDDLVKRGETVVRKFRNQPEVKETVANAKTTVAKVKTVNTQAKHTATKVSDEIEPTTTQAKESAAAVTKSARKTSATVKRTAKKSPAVSSAKATGTSAKKTVASAKKVVG